MALVEKRKRTGKPYPETGDEPLFLFNRYEKSSGQMIGEPTAPINVKCGKSPSEDGLLTSLLKNVEEFHNELA